jgi:hypothetical protein
VCVCVRACARACMSLFLRASLSVLVNEICAGIIMSTIVCVANVDKNR